MHGRLFAPLLLLLRPFDNVAHRDVLVSQLCLLLLRLCELFQYFLQLLRVPALGPRPLGRLFRGLQLEGVKELLVEHFDVTRDQRLQSGRDPEAKLCGIVAEPVYDDGVPTQLGVQFMNLRNTE